MKSYTFQVGKDKYTIETWQDKEVAGFEFKRNNKLQSSVSFPIEQMNSKKLWISEKLLQCAIYDINHFVNTID